MPNTDKITKDTLARMSDISTRLGEAADEITSLAELIIQAETTAVEQNDTAFQRLSPVAERMRLLAAETETLRELRSQAKSLYNTTRLEIGLSMRGTSSCNARERLADASDTLFARKHGLELPVPGSRTTQSEQTKEKINA